MKVERAIEKNLWIIEMLERNSAIKLLIQKAEEAVYVASLPYNNKEYLPWRRNVEDILELAFGKNSSEYERVANCHSDLGGFKSKYTQRYYVKFIYRLQQEIYSIIQKYETYDSIIKDIDDIENTPPKVTKSRYTSKEIWGKINNSFGCTKPIFNRRINFISDKFKKGIINRDIEQAFILAENGFSKPSIILSGSVIEELLRQYLISKEIKSDGDTFEKYIAACENQGLLKKGISQLTNSVRHFRNIVHISNEKTNKNSISKATAMGAVSSIFTISNDF